MKLLKIISKKIIPINIIMNNLRLFSRSFHAFKKPPPSYMFKRPVVPSDFDPYHLKKNIYDCENEKWTSEDKKIKNNNKKTHKTINKHT